MQSAGRSSSIRRVLGWKEANTRQCFRAVRVFLLCRISIGGVGNLTVWDILLAQMKLGPHQKAECAVLLHTCFRYLAESHCHKINMSAGPYGCRIFSFLLFPSLEGCSLQTRYPPNRPQQIGHILDQIVRGLSLLSSQPSRQRNEVSMSAWYDFL